MATVSSRSTRRSPVAPRPRRPGADGETGAGKTGAGKTGAGKTGTGRTRVDTSTTTTGSTAQAPKTAAANKASIADSFETQTGSAPPVNLPVQAAPGATLRQFNLKVPGEEGAVGQQSAAVADSAALELPEDLSAEVTEAANHLFQRYADPTSRELLQSTLEESAFDMNIDMIPDEQRLGRLMGAIPLDEAPVDPPLGPLSAAVLCVGTGTEHKVDDPVALLEQALTRAPDADVIMGPEWLFVPEGRFYSAAEAESLIDQLAALSARTEALFVPGSIAWVDDDGGYHNTALAFEKGHVLKRYDKRNDGDDISFAKAHGATYARGNTDSLFQWRGRTVGLEVCRDHGDARLRWDLETDDAPTARRSVDLQLVVSCGVDLKHPAVGLGGICLVANGDADSPAGQAQAGRRVPREEGMYRAYSPVQERPPAATHDLGQGASLQTFTV